MARKDIGNKIDRENRNAHNDNYKELYKEVNDFTGSITDELYERIIDGAKLNWKEPVSSQSDLPSSAMEGDTRMARDTGKVYRYDGSKWVEIQQIDAGPVNELDSRLTSQLADTAYKNEISNDFIRYGKIDIQDDFPGFKKELPFELFRDRNGIIKHTFDLDSAKTTANKLYISNNGNNNTGDGSVEKPFLNVSGAINKATELSYKEFSIILIDKIAYQDSFVGSYNFSSFEKVVIRPQNEFCYLGRSATHLDFSKDGNSYKVSLSAVMEIVDINNPDYRGVPRALREVNSKADCDNTPNSFYNSGSDVWVHTIDGRKPDLANDLIIIRDMAGISISLGKTKLVLSDLYIPQQGTAGRGTDALKISGGKDSSVILNNIKVSFGTLNSIATSRVGEVYSFDCTTTLAGYDGFNYHGHYPMVENPYEFVFEYDCHSYENGLSLKGTCNATTAHDGMTVLRVNGVGYKCHGPLLADVNGCDSLNYDCVMYDATSGSVNTKSAFWFDEAAAIRQGKAVLINCGGGGIDTHSINSDKNIEIFVKNFKGNNIPDGLILNGID